MIFSGAVTAWSDLTDQAAFNGVHEPLNVCFRHAGSGTSATLEITEMNPAQLVQTQVTQVGNFGNYTFWFNDTTGDEQKCVNQVSWSVGYYDADKVWSPSGNPCLPAPGTDQDASYCTNYQVAIDNTVLNNGPTVVKLVEENGYDYWTVENLFYDAPSHPEITALCNWLKTGTHVLPDPFYAYTCQQDYTKQHDVAYPAYTGFKCAQ